MALAQPFTGDPNLSAADTIKIGQHKAAIRKTFMQAVSDLADGEWTPEDDAALDAATHWLADLVRRVYAKPRQLTSR